MKTKKIRPGMRVKDVASNRVGQAITLVKYQMDTGRSSYLERLQDDEMAVMWPGRKYEIVKLSSLVPYSIEDKIRMSNGISATVRGDSLGLGNGGFRAAAYYSD